MDKVQDKDSSVNQRIKAKFVAREVITCFSYEMDSILKIDGHTSAMGADKIDFPSYDSIENLCLPTCLNCGYKGKFEETEADIDGEGGFDSDKIIFICSVCRKETDEEPDTEPQEIFEWWIVSEFLYNKAKEAGLPVLEWGNNYYWGRCCTGQAILLDGFIDDVCEGMEILDGQKRSWADRK